jgi:1,2-dihydroxy-3-keto-5-methylthiopentene dioxygenase
MKKKWIIAAILFCSLHHVVFAAGTDCAAKDGGMIKLRVYDEKSSAQPLNQTSDYAEISTLLNSIGIRFEKWQANKELSQGASEQDIMDAYKEDVSRLILENGYKSVDVVRIFPDSPNKDNLRQKFLNEHDHSNDEVRFFVEGSALFYIHLNGQVYIVLCEQGDLISIPAKYAHWFDMGDEPHFTAIRFFTDADGWIANFTESDISKYFPKYGE